MYSKKKSCMRFQSISLLKKCSMFALCTICYGELTFLFHTYILLIPVFHIYILITIFIFIRLSFFNFFFFVLASYAIVVVVLIHTKRLFNSLYVLNFGFVVVLDSCSGKQRRKKKRMPDLPFHSSAC